MMAKTKWIFGGQTAPQQPPLAKPSPDPVASSADAKKFGYENFGNTCYVNSVLQTLYFCGPFRDLIIQTEDPSFPRGSSSIAQDAQAKSIHLAPGQRIQPERKLSTSGSPSDTPSAAIAHPHPIPSSSPTLFSALRSLFLYISTHPGDKGTISPHTFIDKLKETKEDFRSTMHQDAHEFLNHLLNMIVEEIEEERKSAQNNTLGEDLSSSVATLASPPTIVTATTSSNSGSLPQEATLVHKLFEGVLTSETRCLTCETVSSRDESFLDLSIDIEQNSSVTACLRSFSASEMLCQRNKFLCDACCDLQEAEKRMKIKKLPNVLALHLKRFKFQEDVEKYIKLTYRVTFPFELRLFNTVDDLENADRLYNLFAIVVHRGNGPHHGHYISIVKSVGSWLVFDDDNVYPIPEVEIPKYFGDSSSGSAYVLYYQATDINLSALGLKPSESERFPVHEPPPHVADAQFGTPSQLGQTTLLLPPGLNEDDALASATTFSIPANCKSPSTVGGGSPVGEPLPVTPPTPGPPSSNRKPLAPIRHDSGRPATAGDKPGRSLHADSSRSPLQSASSPSLAVADDPSAIPPVPPVPPLSPPTPLTPTVPAKLNDRAKEKEKDRDIEKSRKESKAGSWFKRRSFRLGEKSKGDKSHDDTPSSATNVWFKNTPQLKRKSSIGAVDTSSKATNGVNPQLEPPHVSSTASSNTSSNATNKSILSSATALSSPSTSASSSHPPIPSKNPLRPVTSPHPDTHVHPSPSRKLSFTPLARGSIDNHSNQLNNNHFLQGPRPATVPGTVPISGGKRQLPPIPTMPPNSRGESPIMNGTGPPVYDPINLYPSGYNVLERAPFIGTSERASQWEARSHSISTSDSTLNISHPSSSIQNSNLNGGKTSQTIESSTSSAPFKRATRKLSLTAPLRGLGGKKDKDKDKDGEKRKEKHPPNSFMQRL